MDKIIGGILQKYINKKRKYVNVLLKLAYNKDYKVSQNYNGTMEIIVQKNTKS